MNRLSKTLFCIALACLLFSSKVTAHPDPDKFSKSAFTEEPKIVDCTLENGIITQCHEFVVGFLPEGLSIGPFCPENLSETGGLWDWDGDEAKLYRLNRTFFEMLSEQGYRFFDQNEDIAITNPGSGSRPVEDHTCLEAIPDDSVVITMRLPIDPVMAESPTALGTVAKVGVALDGVPIFADAPSLLKTGHLPALDNCGGHIDPGGWYHWHATSTDIDTALANEGLTSDCAVTQDASAVFGYAFDGFPMFGSAEADGSSPEDLDECNAHHGSTSLGEIYHYHASTKFPNLPPCFSGVVAIDNFATTASAGIGSANVGRAQQKGRTPPNLEEVAAKLGVDVEDLRNALGSPGKQPDFANAASILDISEEALRQALPPPPQ